MPFSTKAVANYFLNLADEEPISPMKIQKLVYFAHGWHLAVTGEPLIDEQVEAWRYGPVVPSLFGACKHYGNLPIDEVLDDWEFAGGFKFKRVIPSLEDAGMETAAVDTAKRVIERVWQQYGQFSASQLSNMTHEVGGPWRRVFDENAGLLPKGTDIPTHYIMEHFNKSLSENLQ